MTQNELLAQRRQALQALRARGPAFPNDFRRNGLAGHLCDRFGSLEQEELKKAAHRVCIAGRMIQRRVMGKASFAHLQDMSGRMQIYVRSDALPDGVYADFKQWDLGDILGVEGTVMKTRTGELSIQVEILRLLCKALRPPPEKFHGLSDVEARARQRYLDLISNEKTRQVFRTRTRTISLLRNFLEREGFMEVETPMMHPIPGGAAARPFITHHNSLDMDLYLRIAPELYLKRLVVGGLEQVFEINRSFRNEGLSPRHNPEFTMLEFYQAYVDHEVLMCLTERLMHKLVVTIKGEASLEYQGHRYTFTPPFPRLSLQEAICRRHPEASRTILDDLESIRALATQLNVPIQGHFSVGKIQLEIFEKTVEETLQQPVFIKDYPTEVSPLARCQDRNPELAERFEFFVAGQELANGFSELNDPEEQAKRLHKQAMEKADGDAEAMHYDDEYIKALEHGLPPTAGEGIGVDRLVMLLADVSSIREVILFPQLRAHPDKPSHP